MLLSMGALSKLTNFLCGTAFEPPTIPIFTSSSDALTVTASARAEPPTAISDGLDIGTERAAIPTP